jgi:hypothetical protein
MVQIDVALAASVGSTLAVCARQNLKTETRLWKNGYLGATVAFIGFFLAPTVLYYLIGWPAWDSMYWWDKGTVPAAVPPLVVTAVLTTGSIGFIATHAAIRAGNDRLAMFLPIVFLLPVGVVLVLFRDRVLHVGSQATYAAGAPANLFSSDLLLAFAAIPVFVGIPLVVIALRWLGPELRARRAGAGAAAAQPRPTS